MQYRLSQIAKIIGAESLQQVETSPVIQHIVFDSRRIDFPKESIFFAFSSANNDGHHYISDAYQKGIRAFVIAKEIDRSPFPDATFLLVQNTLAALQKLAIFHRQQFDIPIIGITGSNGKTIIKEWLFQLLNTAYQIVRSPRSYNSQIGVPLSILQMTPQHNLGIFEAGISKVGEMATLAPIIDSTIGLFTNIGEAHSEGFSSQSQKIKEKTALFEHCKTILFCADHQEIAQALSTLPDKKLLSWSRSKKADLQILREDKIKEKNYHIQATYLGELCEINIPFTDAASVENAIHCWLLLLYLGVHPATISKGMQSLDSIPMRLELKAAINNSTLINDSYNSDLTSLAAALNFMRQQSGHLLRTLILSDIFQSGSDDRALYQRVATLLAEHKIDRLIGIGQAVKNLKLYSKVKEQSFYEKTEDFLSSGELYNFQHEIILLKGARDFAFERIAQRLARKSHNTTLEIDLNALVHNLRYFRSQLEANTKMMVMVKAAAYGSGSDEIARLLEFQNVDYLAVAYADEGVELRQAGVTLPIMVLNPELATFEALQQYDLEPEIYSQHLLEQLIQFFPSSTSIRIHLKLDTGMHRLGFEEEQLDPLINTLQLHPQIKVASIFSHLAASDEAMQDDFTVAQIKAFHTLYDQIVHAIGYNPIKHILNTNGIIRFPQYQYDMVRLGIGLYGVGAATETKNMLANVLSLKATISQIKPIPKGETIGYSRKGIAEKAMRIATISIGYADGFLRKAGNGRFSVKIHGKPAPTIGNVCMDMTMVDISEIPEASEGDEVLIFGKELSVEVLAGCYDSLVYEVFTGISERVKRVYFQE